MFFTYQEAFDGRTFRCQQISDFFGSVKDHHVCK